MGEVPQYYMSRPSSETIEGRDNLRGALLKVVDSSVPIGGI